MRRRTRVQLIASAFALVALQCAAQTYPAKPIRVIVPVAAGSPTDIALRNASEQMKATLGQPLIMENRPGAALIVGGEACAKSAGDGYTICAVSSDTVSVNPHTFSRLPYDPERDFRAVAPLWVLIQALVANTSVPVNSVRDLQALAKSKPGYLNFGTMGAGTNPDVFRQWLNEEWKAEIAGIPYKGANLIMAAIAGGEIHLSRISMQPLGGLVKAGKIKILAVGSSRRARAYPDVPTYAEAGLGAFTEKVWWGMVAPAATPAAAAQRLNSEFNQLLRSEKFLEFLEAQYLEPFVLGVEEFAAFMKKDRADAAAMVKRYNVPRE